MPPGSTYGRESLIFVPTLFSTSQYHGIWLSKSLFQTLNGNELKNLEPGLCVTGYVTICYSCLVPSQAHSGCVMCRRVTSRENWRWSLPLRAEIDGAVLETTDYLLF